MQLVLAGGNLTHEGSLLAALVKEKVMKQLPNIRTVTPQCSPEFAAALLALNAATGQL